MSPIQMLPLLFQKDSIPKAEVPPLRTGQVLFGRVEELYHNETALVRLGNFQVQAQLQAPLAAGNSYWFQVQSSGGDDLQLRVIVKPEQNKRAAESILRQFHLPDTKSNRQLLQFFLERNLPITPDTFKQAAEWIGSKTDPTKGLNALEFIFNRNLPFTKETFQALVAVQESTSFFQELKQLQQFLAEPQFASLKTIAPLKQLIADILRDGSADSGIVRFDSGEAVKQLLQEIIHKLGLTYEKEVGVWSLAGKDSMQPLDTLKPLLMSAMAELGAAGEKLEPLLQRLTGMQIIAQDPAAPMQQLVMQLPISFGHMQSDVTIQWNGRKKDNGQIDPDFCRILFYLDLQHLRQTMLDMVVQNKVVHITVVNDTEGIEPIVTIWKPVLKEKLEELGYQLSFINVKPFFKEQMTEFQERQSVSLPKELYQGVDIKI
ncbi:hypothetical protein JK635_22945 [Neobacillus sp. YIM B02564]|uniref:Flagellar hook-length control protein FliK n=1 Tax=Neobacillus paridis TaxID=2803862 RepID=A0ABS1TWA1_9BACI|nr:hypothetical protein [Neobacillus paridis]MBL4955019.1 hypothetical protein [Neobacillus paridis]